MAPERIMRIGREETQRLRYRMITSTDGSPGANGVATMPDTEAIRTPSVQLVGLMLGGVLTESQAPVAQIWQTAQGVEAIRSVTNAGKCQVLICWHTFDPEQASDAQAAEWVVLATSHPLRAEERVDAGMARLAAQTLSVRGTKNFHDIQMPMGEAQMLNHINGGHFAFEAHQLVRKGDFWVASDLQPAPTETGGTVIAHARTNRILYRATTAKKDGGGILVP